MPDKRQFSVSSSEDTSFSKDAKVLVTAREKHANSNTGRAKPSLEIVAPDDADDIWDNMPV